MQLTASLRDYCLLICGTVLQVEMKSNGRKCQFFRFHRYGINLVPCRQMIYHGRARKCVLKRGREKRLYYMLTCDERIYGRAAERACIISIKQRPVYRSSWHCSPLQVVHRRNSIMIIFSAFERLLFSFFPMLPTP